MNISRQEFLERLQMVRRGELAPSGDGYVPRGRMEAPPWPVEPDWPEKPVAEPDDEEREQATENLESLRAFFETEEAEDPEDPEDEPSLPAAERLARGRARSAAAGRHQGPAPYGYHYVRSLLVPKFPEAAVVQELFRLYLRLKSLKRVAAELEFTGRRSPRGKLWSRAGLSWILQNPVYVGRIRYNGEIKGKHQAIVAPSQFNKVQLLLAANEKRKKDGTGRQSDPPASDTPSIPANPANPDSIAGSPPGACAQ